MPQSCQFFVRQKETRRTTCGCFAIWPCGFECRESGFRKGTQCSCHPTYAIDANRFGVAPVGRTNVATAAGTAQTGSFQFDSMNRPRVFRGDSSSGMTPVCSVRPTIRFPRKPWAIAQRLMVRDFHTQPNRRLEQMPAQLFGCGQQIILSLMQSAGR